MKATSTLLKNQALLIVGQTGAGKTLLSKKLSLAKNYPLLITSEIGTILAREKYNIPDFAECFNLPNLDEYIKNLDKYICSCILDEFSSMNKNTLIVDDLISIGAVQMLKAEGVDIKIFHLVAPYELRIKRIMKRLGCPRSKAELEEHMKFLRKKRLGIDEVIAFSEYELDGSKPIDKILADFPWPEHIQTFSNQTK